MVALYGGIKTFPPLQQLLYTIFQFPHRAPTLSPYQKQLWKNDIASLVDRGPIGCGKKP
jgi:hypothetical protein